MERVHACNQCSVDEVFSRAGVKIIGINFWFAKKSTEEDTHYKHSILSGGASCDARYAAQMGRHNPT